MNKLTDSSAETMPGENVGYLTTQQVPEVIVRPYATDDQSASDSSDAQGIDISAIFHAIRRNWLLAAVLGILAAGPMAFAAWTLLPPKYTATALVRIYAEQTLVLQDSSWKVGGRTDFKSYKDTQRQLLLSPQVLNNALKRDGLSELTQVQTAPDPIQWLQSELEVEFPDDSEIMQVSLSLPDGTAAKQLVDAVVSTYYDEIVLAEQNDRAQRVSNLEKAYGEAENRVRAKRSELRNLVELLGTIDPSTLTLFQQAAVQQAILLRTELTKVQFELTRAEGELQYPDPRRSAAKKAAQKKSKSAADQESAISSPLERESSERTVAEASRPHEEVTNESLWDLIEEQPVSEILIDKAVDADRVAAHHADEVERLTALISQTEKRLAPSVGEPMLAKLRANLEASKQSLADRKTELEAYLASQPAPGNAKPDINYRREAEILKKQERRLQAELDQMEAQAKEMGRSSIDAEMLVREVDGLDKVVMKVSDDLERAKIELKSGSRVTVLGPSQVPNVGETKKRLPAAAAAGLMGMFGPLVLLVLFDLRRNLVNSSRSVQDTLQVPILGSIPLVPRRHIKHLKDEKRKGSRVWRNQFSESVAGVTSLVLRHVERDGHRVILVTSASVSEGKTTLASELALSLADAGHRTLLIDFDFRRPALHRRFNLPLGPGTSEVLRENLDPDTAGHQIHQNLTVLTAGSSPGSLLLDAANGTMKALFAECRNRFEIVIVDSPPLLPVVDGRLVGQFTDAAVLSAVRDVSKVPKLCAVKDILSQYRVPVLGCVITGDSNESYYGSLAKPATKRLTEST